MRDFIDEVGWGSFICSLEFLIDAIRSHLHKFLLLVGLWQRQLDPRAEKGEIEYWPWGCVLPKLENGCLGLGN